MEPKGRIFLLPPPERSEKMPLRKKHLKKGFQQQKELNREQGTQERRENEIEGREK